MLNKQITINLITNIAAMGISLLISLWITPFLLNNLGLSAFGYVSLINNIINFLSIITFTLTSMLGRFMIVSIKQNNELQASNYISSAFFATLIICTLLIPILLIITIKLDTFINVNEAYMFDMKISFGISCIAFILSSISVIFSTGSYCKNRLDIKNGINIFSNFVRFSLILFFFSSFNSHIWYVSASLLLQVIVSTIFGFVSYKVLLPDIKVNIKFYRFKNSLEVISSGFSIAVILFGNTLLTQIDLIVGNRYLSAEVVGMYAAILLLPNSIRNMAFAISSAFTPTTISLYSNGDMDGLRKYSTQVVKFCGIMIGWPISVVSGLALPILHIWLGKDYSSYHTTIILMLLPLTAHLAVNQLHNVQQAINKVTIPAIVSILFGGMNILLAIYFTATLNLGIFGIVISGVIMTTIRTVLFMPIYTAIITNQPKFTYYKGILLPVLITTTTLFVAILIQRYIDINSFHSILLFTFVLTACYLIGSITILSKDERRAIMNKGASILRHQIAL